MTGPETLLAIHAHTDSTARTVIGVVVATLVGLVVTWLARRFVRGFRELLAAVRDVAELPSEVSSLVKEVVTLAHELGAFTERVDRVEGDLRALLRYERRARTPEPESTEAGST